MPFAGHRGVQRMVDVVVPLRGQPEAELAARRDEPGIIAVALGDQRQWATQLHRQRVGFQRQLLENVDGGGVHQRVYGIQSQPVDVEVAHPPQRATDEVVTDLVGVCVGDVDSFAPRVAARRQIRAEPRQVVAGWAEVVEHRVDQNTQTPPVAGVDEPHQAVGAAVRFVHGVPEHTVVTPAVRAGERVDRHEFDEIDAEIDQLVQSFDRRVERALRCERADVQFVDDRALDRAARPAGGSGRAGSGPQLRAFVHTVWLPRRAGIGEHLRIVVEHEAVAGIVGDVHGGAPPPVVAAGHRVQDAVDVESHHLRYRCPDREFVVRHRRAPAA